MRRDPIDTAAPPPAARCSEHGHRNLGLALVLISAAQLMVVLDASVVNIALPRIQDDLGISAANLTWVVTSYAIAFGGLLLLGGRMGDIIGRRKVFIGGVLLFAFASLLGGLAQTEWQLLSARALQGAGAAAASPTALALITTTFPAGPPRNRAFAVYAAMSGAGAAIGLILGGALTEVVLALDDAHQRAHRPVRGVPGAALPRRVEASARPLGPAGRGHRDARPGLPRLRLQPQGAARPRHRQPGHLDRLLDARADRRRRVPCWSRSS